MFERKDYIDWTTYFMGIAKLAAKRSKDPAMQVGACVVNKDNKIIGIGYNGLPHGCADKDFPWCKSDNLVESKKPYVVHAELNAILNSTSSTSGATLYVTLFPCSDCTKLVIQAGIKNIVFISDKNNGRPDDVAAKRMLAAAGVNLTKIEDFTLII